MVDSEKILQKLSVVSIKNPLKSKEMAKSYVVKWVSIHGNNVWKSQQQFFKHENLLEILKKHAKVHFWYI